jgi:hypothetical protein
MIEIRVGVGVGLQESTLLLRQVDSLTELQPESAEPHTYARVKSVQSAYEVYTVIWYDGARVELSHLQLAKRGIQW